MRITTSKATVRRMSQVAPTRADDECTLFLCGDVMTGRGIDQVLPHPGPPLLHEPFVRDAQYYWQLAQTAHGPIPRPVAEDYVWGDALEEWARVAPDVRIVNLETAVTTSDCHWPAKEIHYRMSPQNLGCLKAARIDCCVLSNNHVLDWGYAGLTETLAALRRAAIQTSGAGQNQCEAQAPATLRLGVRSRVLVYAFGLETSGIPSEWAAGDDRPGVNLLPDLSTTTVERIGQTIASHRRVGDVVLVSLHWGSNWGYAIPTEQRTFAHQLIDRAGVDVVHGHSSHHVKAIEVHGNRLILYGCGDFLTDYEGISGLDRYRGDLALMYFARVDASTGRLLDLAMTPVQVHRMRLRRAGPAEVDWLRETLNREGAALGTQVRLAQRGTLVLQWR